MTRLQELMLPCGLCNRDKALTDTCGQQLPLMITVHYITGHIVGASSTVGASTLEVLVLEFLRWLIVIPSALSEVLVPPPSVCLSSFTPGWFPEEPPLL